MSNRLLHYIKLADILDYPDEHFSSRIKEMLEFLTKYYPDAAKDFQLFADCITTFPILEQQELFIRSFDVQSLTTLDIGYVLFGDDYKRGELLVNLNREHRAVGNDCGHELADYLPNVLRLLPKIIDESILLEFVEKMLARAIQSMISTFKSDEVDQKEKFYLKKYKTIIDRPSDDYTIYQYALKTLFNVLQQDFNFHLSESTEKTSDFLKNIGTEISLEDQVDMI
jgi:nitrate reductase assembly molybdenum cofactor insertion protein NarJ